MELNFMVISKESLSQEFVVKKAHPLLGSSVKVKVQPGDRLTQLEPPEDGYVRVRTAAGMEGTVAMDCLGNKRFSISLSLLTFKTII